MKKKILISVIFIVIAFLACYNFAQNNDPKNEVSKKISVMEEKTHVRLADAYGDIKDTNKIDESQYTNIDEVGGLQSLSAGEVPNFNNAEYNSFACNTIYQESKNFEIGSVTPLVLLKNDKTEILICTKIKTGRIK